MRAAIEAQDRLRGVLPLEQVELVLVTLREKESALLAQLNGAGAIVQGPGAVGAGAGGVAVGGDHHGDIVYGD